MTRLTANRHLQAGSGNGVPAFRQVRYETAHSTIRDPRENLIGHVTFRGAGSKL